MAELPQTVCDDSFLIPGRGVAIALVVFDSPDNHARTVALAPPSVDVANVYPSPVVGAKKLLLKLGRRLFR